jgi:uncharacterized membrane protein (UPF0127 family)
MRDRTKELPSVSLTAIGRRLDVVFKVADSFKARTLGLAGPSVTPCDQTGLWLPRTSSIHTFGMQFDLALIWLDRRGVIVRIDHEVMPRSLVVCPKARSVIEIPSTSLQGLDLRNGLRLTA